MVKKCILKPLAFPAPLAHMASGHNQDYAHDDRCDNYNRSWDENRQ